MISLSIVVVCLAASANAQAADGAWGSFGRDAVNSMKSNIIIPVSPGGPALLSSFETSGAVLADPVIDSEDNVMVGSTDGLFYKLDSAGELIWRFQARGPISSAAMLESKWDRTSTIYFGDEGGHFHSLLAESGVPKFPSFDAGAGPLLDAPFVRDHFAINGTTAYFSAGAEIIAYDVRNDKVRYRHKFEGIDRIFTSTYGYCSLLLSATSSEGGVVINMNPHSFPGYPLCEDQCTVREGYEPVKFVVETSGPIAAAPSTRMVPLGTIYGVWEPVGDIVVATTTGAIESVHYNTLANNVIPGFPDPPPDLPFEVGALNWRVETGSSIVATPAQAADTVVVGTVGGTLFAVDADNTGGTWNNAGVPMWTFEAGASIKKAVALDGDDKIVLAAGSDLFLLTSEGELLSTWRGEDNAEISTNVALNGEGAAVFGDSAGRVRTVAF